MMSLSPERRDVRSNGLLGVLGFTDATSNRGRCAEDSSSDKHAITPAFAIADTVRNSAVVING
jgi:hypothetical protein